MYPDLTGYVTDERGSLGRNTERTQWVMKRGVSCSAVKLRKQFGYREPGKQTQSVCENVTTKVYFRRLYIIQ